MTIEHKQSFKIFKVFAFIISTLLLAGVLLCSCSDGKLHIKDATGQEQTIEQPITRVVSSHNPTINDVVAVSGGGKYLVGFAFKDRAAGLYEQILPNWSEIQSVWSGRNIDVEAVKKMNPQLAFIPEIQTKNVKYFDEAGVQTFIALPQEESFTTVKESLMRIAKILGEEQHGQEICDKYDNIIQDATNTIKDSKKPKVAFLSSSKDKIYNPESIQHSIIEAGGGENITKDMTSDKQTTEITKSELIDRNPDYIWIPNYADFKIEDLLNDPELAGVSAVQNKHVSVFPCLLEPWDYPTAASSLAVGWVASQLHPDLYTHDKLIKVANDFYKFLYNKDFDAAILGI